MKLRSVTLIISSLVLLISISLPVSSRTAYIKLVLSLLSRRWQRVSEFARVFLSDGGSQISSQHSLSSYCLLWMAPFLSGGGYSSEAWSYILALHRNANNSKFRLAIDHHGDGINYEFWEGLPLSIRKLGFDLQMKNCRDNETIVVCHSEPGAWNPPLFDTNPCPPTTTGNFRMVIGRTMFETERLNLEHVNRCNRMDFIWVPTDYHVSTFIRSGVDPSRVVKMVQPVDVGFFDPTKWVSLNLASVATRVLGSSSPSSNNTSKDFVFLSVFKWEYRKGWDVLLKAYLNEFSSVDGVALYLLTSSFHSGRNFDYLISTFVKDSDMERPISDWAPVYVIDSHVSQTDLPKVYKAADAFVLPTRGEGWGRPIVEAMAMALPTIATNWSGPTEYLTKENSYPLQVDEMEEVMEGPFKGHFWAKPSASKLRVLMRHVASNKAESRSRGERARADMIRRFSLEIVARLLTNHIESIMDGARFE